MTNAEFRIVSDQGEVTAVTVTDLVRAGRPNDISQRVVDAIQDEVDRDDRLRIKGLDD